MHRRTAATAATRPITKIKSPIPVVRSAAEGRMISLESPAQMITIPAITTAAAPITSAKNMDTAATAIPKMTAATAITAGNATGTAQKTISTTSRIFRLRFVHGPPFC